jgi:flagellar biosynthesis protein FlhF
LRLKSYFARDIKTALLMARQELGPEAMLVHSRKAPPEARHLGDCEVVVGVGPAPEPEAAPAPAAPVAEPARAFPEAVRLSAEVAEMRRQIERMASALNRTAWLAGPSQEPAGLSDLLADLLAAEVNPELAHEVLDALRSHGIPADTGAFRRAAAREMAARVTTDSTLGRGGDGPPIAALVGPCGAGKTATLVKLAVMHGLSARRPTQVISMDTYRVAAYEQLRSYAGIIGVGFQALATPGALAQALEEHRRKGLILIDTPGFGPGDMDAAAELASFLKSRPDVDTHLVLTASTRSADLSRVVDRYEIFGPRKLLFTRLDETESFGPIWSEAVRTAKAVSFLSAGQRVPEDLEQAAPERIVDLVLRPAAAGAVAAA